MPVTWILRRRAALVMVAVLATASPGRATLVIGAAGTPVSQNFNGLNTGTTLAPLDSTGWRWTSAVEPVFATGALTPMIVQSATLNTSSSAGTYNFRDGAATSDRAAGFIISSANFRGSLMLELQNSTEGVLESLSATWDLEKYRNGQQGLSISFFHSADGVNWSELATGNALYAGDADFAGLPTPATIAKSATISGLSVASGSKYYLRWTFTRLVASSSTAAVGIDNFTITGTTPVPEASSFLAVGAVAGVAGLWSRVRRRAAADAQRGRGAGIRRP